MCFVGARRCNTFGVDGGWSGWPCNFAPIQLNIAHDGFVAEDAAPEGSQLALFVLVNGPSVSITVPGGSRLACPGARVALTKSCLMPDVVVGVVDAMYRGERCLGHVVDPRSCRHMSSSYAIDMDGCMVVVGVSYCF